MTQGDVLYQFRLRTMALSEELGNRACRMPHHADLAWRSTRYTVLIENLDLPQRSRFNRDPSRSKAGWASEKATTPCSMRCEVWFGI